MFQKKLEKFYLVFFCRSHDKFCKQAKISRFTGVKWHLRLTTGFYSFILKILEILQIVAYHDVYES